MLLRSISHIVCPISLNKKKCHNIPTPLHFSKVWKWLGSTTQSLDQFQIKLCEDSRSHMVLPKPHAIWSNMCQWYIKGTQLSSCWMWLFVIIFLQPELRFSRINIVSEFLLQAKLQWHLIGEMKHEQRNNRVGIKILLKGVINDNRVQSCQVNVGKLYLLR